MNSVFPMNRGQNLCQICMEPHPPQNRCGYDALIRRVTKLAEANAMIPSILQANKEAVETAETFRKMANESAKAIVLIEEEVGPEIWTRVQERLQQAWQGKESSSRGIEEQLSLLESTTPNETENKPSIVETPSGGIIVPDSWR